MKPYWKVTLWYLGFGITWIFCSDKVTAAIADNIQFLSFLQTIKGWLYVLVSGLLIFYLTKKSFQQVIAQDREKLAVFKKTVQSVYHILLNYLNQMQLVTLEAEQSRDFDQDVLRVSKEITDQTLKELMKLDQIDTITSERIDAVVYRDVRGEQR